MKGGTYVDIKSSSSNICKNEYESEDFKCDMKSRMKKINQ